MNSLLQSAASGSLDSTPSAVRVKRVVKRFGSTTALQPIAEASPVTLTADAARTFAFTGGIADSLGGALAWIAGIVALFVPLSVWRYRRMS